MNNNFLNGLMGTLQNAGVGDLDSFTASLFAGAQDHWDAATEAVRQASMNDASNQPRGPPPASTRAIRNLPLIQISPEDLVDPVNRECCICTEEHVLGSTAIRLPCAHIYHRECITDWLERHCTCPVCRYELPTDDRSFEKERVKRMRTRKPRFARHELERLSIKQLKELKKRKYDAIDRADLIDHLIQSGAIDLVASPEPVEYSLSTLRSMGIGKLKRCMNEEAGVFFDPRDVVEKEDMIRIFLNSGRLRVPVEDPVDETPSDSKVSYHTSNSTRVDNEEKTCPMSAGTNGNDENETRISREDLENGDTCICSQTVVETVLSDEESCDSGEQSSSIRDEFQTSQVLLHKANETGGETARVETRYSEDSQNTERCHRDVSEASLRPTICPLQEFTSENSSDMKSSDMKQPASAVEDGNEQRCDDINVSSLREISASEELSGLAANVVDQSLRQHEPAVAESIQIGTDDSARFVHMTVSQIRRLAVDLSVDLTGCFERQDIVDRILDIERARGGLSLDSNREIPLSGLSMSDMLALASLLGKNLEGCGGRKDLEGLLLREMRQGPHVARFFLTMVPLVQSTVSQLRAIGRARGVNLSDCLEKGEMIRRLVEWDRF